MKKSEDGKRKRIYEYFDKKKVRVIDFLRKKMREQTSIKYTTLICVSGYG